MFWNVSKYGLKTNKNGAILDSAATIAAWAYPNLGRHILQDKKENPGAKKPVYI